MISPSVLLSAITDRAHNPVSVRKHLHFEMHAPLPEMADPTQESCRDTGTDTARDTDVEEQRGCPIPVCMLCVHVGGKRSLRGRPNYKAVDSLVVDDVPHDQPAYNRRILTTWPAIALVVASLTFLFLYLCFASYAAQRFFYHFHRAMGPTSADMRNQHLRHVASTTGTATMVGEVYNQNLRRKAFMLRTYHQRQLTDIPNQNVTTSKQTMLPKLPVYDDHDFDFSEDVYHNLSRFKKSYEMMEKTFRIYVYKDGYKPLFHGAKTTGIYASEGLFLERMEHPWNRFIVSDPAKAHMYFMPYSVRQIVDYLQDPNSHSMRILKTYVANYVAKIASKYPFWNRTQGADHFFVSCHDWAPDSARNHGELRSNAMKVVCNADVTQDFEVNKDVSLPQTLHSSRNVDTFGLELDERPFLAFFAGQMHGPVRPVLVQYWKDKDPSMRIYEVLPPAVAVNISYTQHMKLSKFCICPKGFEVNSPRLVESILNDCVPVIISDNFILPFSDVLDWKKFSITVPERDIPNLKDVLMGIPHTKYQAMQRRLKHVRRHFEWLEAAAPKVPVRYDVFHMILYSIWIQRQRVSDKTI